MADFSHLDRGDMAQWVMGEMVQEVMGLVLEEATYNTINDYINYLNSDNKWVIYDSNTNRATITNVGIFYKKV